MIKTRSYNLTGLTDRSILVAIILVVNAFVWYYSVLVLLQVTITSVLVWSIHFFGLISSAFIGASLVKRIGRSRLLALWMIFGTVSSMTLFELDSSNIVIVSSVALLLGLTLGLGMPTCMSYYTDCVSIEKRGRISGLTMLLSGIGILAFMVSSISDKTVLGIVLAVWRLLSLAVFLLAKSHKTMTPKSSYSSYRVILSQESFILYFLPWVIFSFVNYLAVPFQPSLGAPTSDIMLVQLAFMGIAAISGGFFMDSVGRKRIAIAGFAMLGIGTAVLGVSSNLLIFSYFSAAIDGIAWGFLLVLFILAIWGDLSPDSASDKYYALGVLPFFASRFLDISVGPYLIEHLGSTAALFSLTAFFLFLAVLPLVYAPETLPEKITKDRELRIYVDKAQEIKKRHS